MKTQRKKDKQKIDLQCGQFLPNPPPSWPSTGSLKHRRKYPLPTGYGKCDHIFFNNFFSLGFQVCLLACLVQNFIAVPMTCSPQKNHCENLGKGADFVKRIVLFCQILNGSETFLNKIVLQYFRLRFF